MKIIQKDLEVHDWAATFLGATEDRICYSGEFGSGKTSMSVYKCYNSLMAYPGLQLIVLRNLYRELKTATIPDFFDCIWGAPEAPKPSQAKWNASDYHLVFPNKSKVLFFAADKKNQISTLRGLHPGMLWIDQGENIPEDIYVIACGRVRQKGMPCQVIDTPNPGGDGHYLRRDFFMPEYEIDVSQEKIKGRDCVYGYWKHKEINDDRSVTSYLGITPRPMANAKNLKPGYYSDLIRSLSYEQSQKLVFAQWYGASGNIYEITADNYKDNYQPSEYTVIERFEGMDYGISETGAMTWYNVVYDNGTYYITDEFYKYKSSIGAASEFSKMLRNKWEIPAEFQTGCPAVFQSEGGSGHRLRPADLFIKMDINLSPYPIQINTRREILGPLFKLNKILIDGKCSELIKELRGYTWEYEAKCSHHAIEAIERAISRHWQSKQGARITDKREITEIHAAAPYMSNDF
jgi:hypothetical protein